MALIHCPECGNLVSDTAEVCHYCGNPLKERTQTCPECGQQIPEGAQVCPECGYPLTQPAYPSPQPQPEFNPSTPQEPQPAYGDSASSSSNPNIGWWIVDALLVLLLIGSAFFTIPRVKSAQNKIVFQPKAPKETKRSPSQKKGKKKTEVEIMGLKGKVKKVAKVSHRKRGSHDDEIFEDWTFNKEGFLMSYDIGSIWVPQSFVKYKNGRIVQRIDNQYVAENEFYYASTFSYVNTDSNHVDVYETVTLSPALKEIYIEEGSSWEDLEGEKRIRRLTYANGKLLCVAETHGFYTISYDGNGNMKVKDGDWPTKYLECKGEYVREDGTVIYADLSNTSELEEIEYY